MNSGFYRIYLKLDQEEYSYIGISKNIKNRVEQHFKQIKSFYGSKKLLVNIFYHLQNATIPSQNALYVKLVFFLHYKDCQPEDLRWEILEINDINHISSQFKEMMYIKLYQADYRGFNGIFAKDFQLLFNYNESYKPIRKKLLKLKEQQDKHKVQIWKKLKLCKNKNEYDQQFMPWISWQFRSVLEPVLQNYFDEFCANLLKKIKLKIYNSYSQLGYTKQQIDEEINLIQNQKRNFNFQTLIKKSNNKNHSSI